MQPIKLFRRARVHTELLESFNYPLTVITAPMGYGKTTVAREFFKGQKIKTIWLSLTGSDGSIPYVWSRLCAQVSRINEPIGRRLYELGPPLDETGRTRLLEILEEAFERCGRLALVLDDYHLISCRQLNRLLEMIAYENIPTLRIVLITRYRLSDNIVNLRSKSLCYEIDGSVLAFRREEIEGYAAQIGCRLTPAEVDRIFSYTNGWISAVHLLLLGLLRGNPLTEIRDIKQLIENNIYLPEDPHTKQTLLRLASMDCFTLPQAEFVLGSKDVRDVVRRLVEQNAFLDYDTKSSVYRLHSVFLDYLTEQQTIRKMDCAPLYYRAGIWLWDHSDPLIAAQYLNRSGSFETVLHRLNQEGGHGLRAQDLLQLGGAFEQQPQSLWVCYPIAFLRFAGVAVCSGDAGLESLGRRIAQRLHEHFLQECPDECCRSRVLGEVALVEMLGAFNDPEKMIEQNDRAQKLMAGMSSVVLPRDFSFTFGVPHLLYCYYTRPGFMKETAQYITQRFPELANLTDGWGMGCDYQAMAEYHLETCDEVNCELMAWKAYHYAGNGEQTSVMLCSLFTLARLFLFQNKVDDAIELLKTIQNTAGKSDNPVVTTMGDLCTGYLYACLGKKKLLPGWLFNGDSNPAGLPREGVGFGHIVSGRIRMLKKEWLKLETGFGFRETPLERYQVQLGLLHNQIHHAVARQHLYGAADGVEQLERALAIARPDGIVLPFAENAPYLLGMLKDICAKHPQDEYCRRVLRCCRRYDETLSEYNQTKKLLTDREIDVLRLLADGLKREEIAERLLLSLSTVKTNIQNIFLKLDCNNKITAIKRAREMQIL